MDTRETNDRQETAQESPQPPGFNEGGGASYYAPEGFSDPTEDSGFANSRI